MQSQPAPNPLFEQPVCGADIHSAEHANRFAVNLVSTRGSAYGHAFSEIAESIHYGLVSLGYDSIITTHVNNPGRCQILLGAHLLNQFSFSQPTRGSIIYNFEQADALSTIINSSYFDLLKRHQVWDWSARNIAILKQKGVHDIHRVPIGWMPQLTRIAPAIQDIDVLFDGAPSERRLRIINELKARNVRVEHTSGIFGRERDNLIARSKIVLNLHDHESGIFEIARVSYLLANEVCVVSENGLDPAENEFSDSLAFAPYGKLVETCLVLLSNPEGRAFLAAHGKRSMQSLREDRFLHQVLKNVSRNERPDNENHYSGYDPNYVPPCHDIFYLTPPVRTVNQRRYLRIPCRNVQGCIETKQGASVIVRLLNISRGGVAFTSSAEFYTGTPVSIATHYIEGGQNIFTDGRIIRVQRQATADWAGEYAIEFCPNKSGRGLDEGKKANLQATLEPKLNADSCRCRTFRDRPVSPPRS